MVLGTVFMVPGMVFRVLRVVFLFLCMGFIVSGTVFMVPCTGFMVQGVLFMLEALEAFSNAKFDFVNSINNFLTELSTFRVLTGRA